MEDSESVKTMRRDIFGADIMGRQHRLYESPLNTTWGMEMGNPRESQLSDRDIRGGFRPGLRSRMGQLKHRSRHCLSLFQQVSAGFFLWPLPKIRRYLDDFWISYAVARYSGSSFNGCLQRPPGLTALIATANDVTRFCSPDSRTKVLYKLWRIS